MGALCCLRGENRGGESALPPSSLPSAVPPRGAAEDELRLLSNKYFVEFGVPLEVDKVGSRGEPLEYIQITHRSDQGGACDFMRWEE